MQLTHNRTLPKKRYISTAKSFLIWCFALTVTLLVVGFPLVVLMATVGALLSITLHPILPVSAVLLVAGGTIALNILAVMLGAVILTAKGINPQEVRWLSWLHGDAEPVSTTTYAACPLTCDIDT
ncbi:MAG: hypothetical protein RLZZ135_754 [Cyanobacteriota bacterium]|jgi:hypothetical protein